MTIRSVLCPLPRLGLLLLLVAGCREPASPDFALEASRARQDLPFYLSGDAVLAGRQFAPNAGPPSFGRSTFDGRCSEPADVLLRFEVSGQATYLGAVSGVVEHCSQLDFTTFSTIAITDGVQVWTAANGDELRGEHERPEGAPDELVEWVGGTGRFADATGEAVARPVCDPAAGTCILVIEGVLGLGRAE